MIQPRQYQDSNDDGRIIRNNILASRLDCGEMWDVERRSRSGDWHVNMSQTTFSEANGFIALVMERNKQSW